jgi:hypothetical protein
LAVATFASVRSANRAAGVAEKSLLVGVRPVLAPSGPNDEDQRVRFGDGRHLKLLGGYAAAQIEDDNIYLAISLRNVGNGIGVLYGWRFCEHPALDQALPNPETFRLLVRDMFISPGVVGFWQAALRDASDPDYGQLRAAIESGGG